MEGKTFWKIRLIMYPLGFIMQEENDMLRVMQRLEALENSQKASVESAL